MERRFNIDPTEGEKNLTNPQIVLFYNNLERYLKSDLQNMTVHRTTPNEFSRLVHVRIDKGGPAFSSLVGPFSSRLANYVDSIPAAEKDIPLSPNQIDDVLSMVEESKQIFE